MATLPGFLPLMIWVEINVVKRLEILAETPVPQFNDCRPDTCLQNDGYFCARSSEVKS
jgi:hypothetical protein